MNPSNLVGGNPLLYADPKASEDWGDIVHRQGTNRWAGAAGFEPEVAQDLASAALSVDYDDDTNPAKFWSSAAQSWHFNIYDSCTPETIGQSPGDSRLLHCRDQLAGAIERLQGGRPQGEWVRELGRGLHPLQDCFAHADEYVTEVIDTSGGGHWWTHANAHGWWTDVDTVKDFTDRDEKECSWEPTRASPCRADREGPKEGWKNGRLAISRMASLLYLHAFVQLGKCHLSVDRWGTQADTICDLVKVDLADWATAGENGRMALSCLSGFLSLLRERWPQLLAGDELFKLVRERVPEAKVCTGLKNVVKVKGAGKTVEYLEYAAIYGAADKLRPERTHDNDVLAARLLTGVQIMCGTKRIGLKDTYAFATDKPELATTFQFVPVGNARYLITTPRNRDQRGRPYCLDCTSGTSGWVYASEYNEKAEWWVEKVGESQVHLGLYKWDGFRMMQRTGYSSPEYFSVWRDSYAWENKRCYRFDIVPLTQEDCKASWLGKPERAVTCLRFPDAQGIEEVRVKTDVDTWATANAMKKGSNNTWVFDLEHQTNCSVNYSFGLRKKGEPEVKWLEVQEHSQRGQLPPPEDSSDVAPPLTPPQCLGRWIDMKSVKSKNQIPLAGPNGYLFFLNVTSDRQGAEKDPAVVADALGSYFSVMLLLSDPSPEEFWSKLALVKELDHSSSRSFVFLSGSHGSETESLLIEDTTGDGIWVPSKMITDMFSNNPTSLLAGKPKLFMFASCRGNKRCPASRDVPESASIVVEGGDLGVVRSTLHGYTSARQTENGTCLFLALRQTILRNGPAPGALEVLPMLFKVDKALKDITWDANQRTANGCSLEFDSPSSFCDLIWTKTV